MLTRGFRQAFVAASLLLQFVLFLPAARADMTAMDDEALSGITGQALLVADKIVGSSIAGYGGAGSSSDFTYYRVGLDGILDMNMNVDKFYLGCGGVNDALDPGVCDIQIDYVRLMGRCSGANCGQTWIDGKIVSGSGDAVTSDFRMIRPYIELAIRNDGSKTQREFAGVKIGAQTVDGYMGLGSICSGCDPANVASHGSSQIAISGYLNARLSVWLTVDSALGGGNACVGIPSFVQTQCAGWGAPSYAAIPQVRTTGTRQRELQAPDTRICCLQGASGLLSLFTGQDMYLHLREDLRYLHGFTANNTNDLFLSMQRERVRYPRYDKTGFAVEANTGWWMNIPAADLLDLNPPTVDLGCPGFICLGALDAFGSPGLFQQNVDLGSRPVDNCYGQTEFC